MVLHLGKEAVEACEVLKHLAEAYGFGNDNI